ncbi:uncharacterized protein TRIADDRAFT_6313, partial [Trichoplax adhaerens]
YKIEGKVSLPNERQLEWTTRTKILVDGTKLIGFLQYDGSFTVHNVPAGSHIVHVASPNYYFEPVRVDISRSKGKIRARKVNYLQPSQVSILPYPLKLRAKEPMQFFEQRQSWKMADILYNPMVIMMVLPLLLVVVLPKLLSTNDPEVQKELQNMNVLQQSKDLPEMSTFFQWMFPEGKKGK